MKTLLEHIADIKKKAGDITKLNKDVVTTIYRNKKNKEDVITEPIEFFRRKLNTVDYEEEVLTYSLKNELKKEIFGSEDYEITEATYKAVDLEGLLIALNEKPVSEFKKNKITLANKVNALEKIENPTEEDLLKLTNARVELIKLYHKEEKPPKEKSKIYPYWLEYTVGVKKESDTTIKAN